MNPVQFDAWTRALATSRGALAGAVIAGFAAGDARAGYMAAAAGHSPQPTASVAGDAATATPVAPRSVCANPDVGDLAGCAIGDLLDYEEITARDDPNFPSGARAWRVLYVSTSIDNLTRAAICGIVVAPDALEKIALQHEGDQTTARGIAWCHGTLGMTQRCQPSSQPASEIWGPTPYGINALVWGSAEAGDLHTGTPENGILAGLIAAGWVVVASDYLTGLGDADLLEPYAAGKVEAANTIDNLRAAHHLLTQVYPGYAPGAYDVIPGDIPRADTPRSGPGNCSMPTPPPPPPRMSRGCGSPALRRKLQAAISLCSQTNNQQHCRPPANSIGWPTPR